MLTASWMMRYSYPIIGFETADILDELDNAGYYSVLFTIDTRWSDYLPRIANAMKPSHKIKYMLALRPYLLSPQYTRMLVSGFDAMIPNKIIINWVHGHIADGENFDGIINNFGDLSDKSVRKNYLDIFLDKFNKIQLAAPQSNIPESIISGGSMETLMLVQKHGYHFATSYDRLLRTSSEFKKFSFQKMFVQVAVLPRKTHEEAEDVYNRLVLQNNIKDPNMIYGSYEELRDKIANLETLGATDILFSNAFPSDHTERSNVHDFVNYLRQEGVAS